MIKSLLHCGVQKTWETAPFLFFAVRKMGLPERLWRHLYFDGDLTIEVNKTAAFRIHHYGYRIENEFFWAGFGNTWEATSLKLWCLLARRVGAIFDIGANTGVYALSANAVNPSARIHAFEPVTRVYERLQKNIALNDCHIRAIRAGISEHTGTATLYESSAEHIYSASLEANADLVRGDLIQTDIRTYSLIDYLAEAGEDRVDLVKIDTEKHELAVLRGFGDLIVTKRPAIIIEILNSTLGEEIQAFFQNSDYIFYEIEEGTGIARTGHLGRGGRNYLICPKAFAEEHSLGDSVSDAELRSRNDIPEIS